MKIVFLDRLTLASHINLARPSFAHQWQEYPSTTPQQVLERCQDANIIIVNKVQLSRDTLTQLPQLKMIAVAATGTNNVDHLDRLHFMIFNLLNQKIHLF